MVVGIHSRIPTTSKALLSSTGKVILTSGGILPRVMKRRGPKSKWKLRYRRQLQTIQALSGWPLYFIRYHMFLIPVRYWLLSFLVLLHLKKKLSSFATIVFYYVHEPCYNLK